MPMYEDKYTLEKRVYNNPLLHLHLFGMRLFGYVIFDNQRLQWWHNLRGIVFTVTFAVFNISQFADLYGIVGQFDQMTTNASTTLLFTTTFLRMCSFYSNRMQWLNLIRHVNENTARIWRNGNAHEKNILNRHVRYTFRLTCIFWIAALVTSNLMCIMTLVRSFFADTHNETAPPSLILRSWFPFNITGTQFYVAYAIQLYVMWLGMIIVPAWNSLMVALMTYAIVELELLNSRLIEPQSPQEQCENLTLVAAFVTDQKRYENLIGCIDKNIAIIRFVSELKGLMFSFVFLDFVLYSVLLCALLFQTSRTEIGIQLAIHVCYIFTMISILWIYYWHANEIMLWSDRLSSSLYQSNWHRSNSTAQYKKAVHIFLIFTLKPIKMRVGFLDMNLNNFINVKILRAAYSYYTILSQLEKN